jgi:anti-sigma regulatory factor (Ser/Thr protein kinase)
LAGPGISTSAAEDKPSLHGVGRVLGEVSASSVVLLPCTPASVAVARRALSDELRAAGIFDSAIRDAVLVVSELLSNAILHADPLPGESIRVTWDIDGSWVEVAVSDGGSPTLPLAAEVPVSSLGGRGLSIVSHLCDAWGVRSDELGLTVWAVMRAPRYPDGSDADGPDLAPEQVSAGLGGSVSAGLGGSVNDGMRSSACEA